MPAVWEKKKKSGDKASINKLIYIPITWEMMDPSLYLDWRAGILELSPQNCDKDFRKQDFIGVKLLRSYNYSLRS